MIIKNDFLELKEAVLRAALISSVQNLSYYPDFSLPQNIKNCEYVETEYPISSAIGASSLGKRVMAISFPNYNDIKDAVNSRLPLVVFSSCRPEDIMFLRDCGSLMFFCESLEELVLSIITAFRISEDPKVLLPSIIIWNGPLDYSETLILPSETVIKSILPELKLPHRLDIKKPSNIGIQENYEKTRQQQEKAMENASKLISSFNEQIKKKLKKDVEAVEKYKTEDADMILITYGYHSSTAKAAIDKMRNQGKKVGLVKIRTYRPFPLKDLSFLKERKVAVLDFSYSPGSFSPLYQEVCRIPRLCIGFISIEKYLSEKDFESIFLELEKAEKEEIFWM